MRLEALPSPGQLSGSHKLRVEVCKAISFCEVASNYNIGKTPTQVPILIAFFEAAIESLLPLIQETETVKRRARTTKEAT